MDPITPQVSVTDLDAALSTGAVLIDVREPDEWLEARVAGGLHIPLGQVQARVAEVPTDTRVYVICRSGGRSQRAADWLRQQGIDAVNVSGGTLAWIDAGLDVSSGPAT